MKNSHLKTILGIIGGIVVAAAIAVALIRYWDSLKKLLPGNRTDEFADEFDTDDLADVEI